MFYSVVELAENAMDMLKRIKAGTKANQLREGKRKAREEVNHLFNYSKCKKAEAVKRVQWKHKFVCLAYRDQTRTVLCT